MTKTEIILEEYKPSPVGKIPSDWAVKTVGEAYEICNNLRLPISEEERKKIKGEYPYYGPTKIQDYINEYRLEGTYALIGEDGDHFLKWKELPMTLLVNGRFNVNNHAHIILGTENLTEWFFYYFNHRELTPHLTRQGAGRYKLSKGSLSKILCPLPPLSEQKAIAHVLGLMDSAINTNNQLIAKKELQKKWLIYSLLTKKLRLEGFSDDWNQLILSEIVNITTGKVDVNSGNPKGKYPFYTCAKEVTYSDNYSFDEEAILISGNGVGVGYCQYYIGKFEAYQRTYVLTRFKEINIQFLLKYLKAYLKRKIISNKQDGAMPYIKLGTLENFIVSFPSLEEQSAIAKVLQISDKEIQLLKAKIEKLRKQKKGLMQVLLTGKKRLKMNTNNY